MHFDTPGKISPNVVDDKQPSLIFTSRISFLLLPLILNKTVVVNKSPTLVFCVPIIRSGVQAR
jgi:hypothetical protein